jgi:hypothetical protein
VEDQDKTNHSMSKGDKRQHVSRTCVAECINVGMQSFMIAGMITQFDGG